VDEPEPLDSNADSNPANFGGYVGVRRCSRSGLDLRKLDTRTRVRTRLPLTGGQVVAGSNPVSPTEVRGGFGQAFSPRRGSDPGGARKPPSWPSWGCVGTDIDWLKNISKCQYTPLAEREQCVVDLATAFGRQVPRADSGHKS
jgi:hypothetical protein